MACPVILLAWLVHNGILWFVYPSKTTYPIQGIDISHHQGKIQWQNLPKDEVSFVYIKATEGSHLKDKRFGENWQASKQLGIRRGAYHFFTACRSGVAQAENFIRSVPVDRDALPPVLDAEFSQDCKEPENVIDVQKEVSTFITLLEKHYRKPVVIYTTDEFMRLFPLKEFATQPIWIRSIFSEPTGVRIAHWQLWQYKNRGRLKGIQGFVDLNVFHGDQQKFIRFATATR